MQVVRSAQIKDLAALVNEQIQSGMQPFQGVQMDGGEYYQLMVLTDMSTLSKGMFDAGFDPDKLGYEVVEFGNQPVEDPMFKRPYLGTQEGPSGKIQVYTTVRFSALASHLNYVDTKNERAQQLAKDAHVKMLKFLSV
jgi:hypothetical protein